MLYNTFYITRIIPLCWIAFLAFWLATAMWSKRPARREGFSGVFFWYRFLLVIGVILLFFMGGADGRVYPMDIVIIPHAVWIEIVADIIAVIGAALAISARINLGSNWSATVQIKENHALVTRGVYRYMRHPIYTALLSLFLGTALAVGTIGGLLGFVFAVLSCWIKLKSEESLMLKQFPNEYPAYKARVKALIPFIF